MRGVKDYWTKRWDDIPADEPMENLGVYPLKYAQMTVKDKEGKILEAGCGAGRILRYYHDRGYDIIGFDFIDVAISKLKGIDPTLNAEVGDITNLRFADQSFKYVLAFGLYHNLENGLDKAILETNRVLEKNGLVCASFRADNIQTKLTDYLSDRKMKKRDGQTKTRSFHKMNLTRSASTRNYSLKLASSSILSVRWRICQFCINSRFFALSNISNLMKIKRVLKVIDCRGSVRGYRIF